MEPKHRKILLICLGIVVASYIVRSAVIASMRMAYYQQQAIRAAQRKQSNPKAVPSSAPQGEPSGAPTPPTSGLVASGESPAAAVPPSTKAPPFAKFLGIWRGRAALDGRGLCDLKFVLNEKQDEPGHFSGYSTMTCYAAGPLMSTKKFDPRTVTLNQMDPEAAIFSSVMENGSMEGLGSMEFRADKVVGTDSNGCAPTSFSLTPFGANQLAAEWHEATCAGGRMILHKARQ